MRFLILLYFFATAGNGFAQTSAHGFSFRAGIKAMDDYAITQPDPEVARINIVENPAHGASLRYNYYFSDRISAYAGFGVTLTNSFILFERGPFEGQNFRFGSGPGVNQAVSQIELGVSYAYPLTYRLSLVAEVGGQLVNVGQGGGFGTQRTSNEAGEILLANSYSYLENPNQETGFALQVAPGLRYQLSDRFYLTLRGDFIFSGTKLLESGMMEASNKDFPEPTTGTFERTYAGKGIDLMASYRF